MSVFVLGGHRQKKPAVSLPTLLSVLACAVLLAGCTSLVNSVMAPATDRLAGNLASAILNQDDPELVAEALPAYLLLFDSLTASPTADPEVLGAAARLYAVYAVVFVRAPLRAATLAGRARTYGARASCTANAGTCDLFSLPFADYSARLEGVKPTQSGALFSYALGSLAYVRTHAEDFSALAELPKIEAVLKRLLIIGQSTDKAAINTYLGILATLRPPALGGQPEQGRVYFEKAIELTDGKDLSVLVEFARGYARLVYDQELHDALLERVITANPYETGYTLMNILAVRQAIELRASAKDYF